MSRLKSNFSSIFQSSMQYLQNVNPQEIEANIIPESEIPLFHSVECTIDALIAGPDGFIGGIMNPELCKKCRILMQNSHYKELADKARSWQTKSSQK